MSLATTQFLSVSVSFRKYFLQTLYSSRNTYRRRRKRRRGESKEGEDDDDDDDVGDDDVDDDDDDDDVDASSEQAQKIGILHLLSNA